MKKFLIFILFVGFVVNSNCMQITTKRTVKDLVVSSKYLADTPTLNEFALAVRGCCIDKLSKQAQTELKKSWMREFENRIDVHRTDALCKESSNN